MSLIVNCGRLVGPVLAGLLIAWFSEATCFLINALSYIAVLLSFAFIRVKPQQSTESHLPALHGIMEGMVYAWRTVPIRFLLALLVIVAFTAAPYSTLMPAIVHEAFAGNAETLGFLVGAAGMGAICGTLLLAARRDVRGLVRFSVAAAFGAGCALIALSWSRSLALSLALMVAIGFSILVISVSVNMILQTIVDDDKRGRVMSLYTAAFLGVMPLGGLIAGTFADQIGAVNTVLAGGFVCGLAALYMARQLPLLQQHMRPIYARLGINAE
jgi:MFS family permease